MSTVASEKNRELLFIGNVFYKQWPLCVLFHQYFEGTTSQILIPSKKPDFRYGKNQFSERAKKMEFRSRSTPKSQALGLTCVRSQSSRELIKNATISSTFLKINKSRERFLLRLSTKFLAVLRCRYFLGHFACRNLPQRGLQVVSCHILIIFFLAGRLHCGGFQILTEQIFSLLFVSHLPYLFD